MENIARVASHLNFVIDLGVAASEVSPLSFAKSIETHAIGKASSIAKACFAVLKLGFSVRMFFLCRSVQLLNVCQKFTSISDEYAKLKDVALECIHIIESDEEAREIFTTSIVRNQLKMVLILAIDALVCISCHYKKSRSSTLPLYFEER